MAVQDPRHPHYRRAQLDSKGQYFSPQLRPVPGFPKTIQGSMVLCDTAAD